MLLATLDLMFLCPSPRTLTEHLYGSGLVIQNYPEISGSCLRKPVDKNQV